MGVGAGVSRKRPREHVRRGWQQCRRPVTAVRRWGACVGREGVCVRPLPPTLPGFVSPRLRARFSRTSCRILHPPAVWPRPVVTSVGLPSRCCARERKTNLRP